MSLRQYTSFFLSFILIVSLLLPQSVMAVQLIPPVPVNDGVQNTINAGITVLGVPIPGTSLDAIATLVAKRAVESIVDSTVDWINSGFDGNPSFVSNPGQYLTSIADEIAGEYIDGAGLSGLCTPFQASIRISLQQSYLRSSGRSRSSTAQCTLTGIVNNIDNFYDDFSEGGWAGWFSMTQENANNPYGAYMEAQVELDSRIASALKIQQDQLNWGRGFLSTKGPDGEIRTPGTVIETQLENVLGTGVRQLELADEFDEVIGALVSQLLQRTVFSQNGLNSGGSSDNGNQPVTPTPQVVVACTAAQENVALGESALWIAESSLRTPSYTWYGEAVEGQTTPSVSVRYSTPGIKSASVIVTGKDSTGQTRTAPAECENTVIVTDQNGNNGIGSGGVSPI
jgi:hypothetical protein